MAAARRTRRAEIRAAATAEKDRLYAIVDGKRAAAVAAKAVSGVCCDPAKMESRETFKSQFKIGWMSSAAVQPAEMSSYQDLQCGNHVQVLAALKAGVDEGSAGSTHKYHPITAPYGGASPPRCLNSITDVLHAPSGVAASFSSLLSTPRAIRCQSIYHIARRDYTARNHVDRPCR